MQKALEINSRDFLDVKARERGAELVDNLTYCNYAWNRRVIAARRLTQIYPLAEKYERRFQEEVARGERQPGFGDSPAAA